MWSSTSLILFCALPIEIEEEMLHQMLNAHVKALRVLNLQADATALVLDEVMDTYVFLELERVRNLGFLQEIQ